MPLVTDAYRYANYAEAALWILIGVIAAAIGLRNTGSVRRRCLILAITLLAFGGSDIVESRGTTGVWWDPWWLAAWKVGCVTIFVVLLIGHYRSRRSPTD